MVKENKVVEEIIHTLDHKMWIKNSYEGDRIDPPYICPNCGCASMWQYAECDSCGSKMILIDYDW